LNYFQHLDEVEFLHDVDGNSSFRTPSYENCLGHRVVHGEEAQPFSEIEQLAFASALTG
jgi:hypothetical protein